MKKGVKIVIVLLILLGVAFLVGRRVLKPKEEVEHTQLPLATGISVEKGDLSITESLVGTIEASEQYALASKVSGEVLEIYAENGAELKKGDKIARLESRLMRQNILWSRPRPRRRRQATPETVWQASKLPEIFPPRILNRRMPRQRLRKPR